MSQNVTLESLQKTHGKDAAEVFNTISDLGGFGVRATGFDSHDGGLAVNENTPNFNKIEKLLIPPPAEDDPLGQMNKADLLAEAAARGVEVSDSATKADIIAAIQAKEGK